MPTVSREWFERKGFRVLCFATAEEAVSALKTERPSLIILDIRLAGAMDGWEFLTRLRVTPACMKIPVVIASGLTA